MKKAMERWIPIYRLFVFERFLRFSRGGGNWKRLRRSYVREKQRNGYSTGILTRTNILKQELRPKGGARGVLVVRHPNKLTVVFAPRKKYPSGIAVRQVLSIHDEGQGHMPRRTVLVSPDNRVFKKMVVEAEKGFRKDLDE